MEKIMGLLHNYVLIVALTAWLTAQVMKTILWFIVTKRFNPERLVGAGGMPSAHSAPGCRMMIAIAKTSGLSSPEFAIAFVLAFVVMYDAMGVRRAAGEQAKVLNRMLEKQVEEDEKMQTPELKEFLGHTPLQVLGGSLLGILIAMIIPV